MKNKGNFEKQREFLISEEAIQEQSEEVKNFLQSTNQILKRKTIEERKIFLNNLQKTLERQLKENKNSQK